MTQTRRKEIQNMRLLALSAGDLVNIVEEQSAQIDVMQKNLDEQHKQIESLGKLLRTANDKRYEAEMRHSGNY